MSPEYLFHSASTEADGSSVAGRCPKILLKKLLDMLAQYVPSQGNTPDGAGSISAPISRRRHTFYYATASMPKSGLSCAILQSTMHAFPQSVTPHWWDVSQTASQKVMSCRRRLSMYSPPCNIEAWSTLMEGQIRLQLLARAPAL